MTSWQEKDIKGKDFLQWAQQQQRRQSVRVDSQLVPRAVAPGGRRLVLHDLRVFVRRGPDDAAYDKSEQLRRRMARGNLLLEVGDGDGDGEGPPAGCYVALYALRKFTGGCGDDDDRDGDGDADGDGVWRRYFTEPMEQTAKIVRTRKANGEAFHLAVMRIGGVDCFLGGSKNCHLMFREMEHLDFYTEPRCKMAKDFCADFLKYFRQLADSDRQNFVAFLRDNAVTAVFEILYADHQHVELLTNQTPLPKFITFTSNDTDCRGATFMPPDRAIDIARGFGLDCIDFQVCSLAQLDLVCNEIRGGYGYEGEVLYFLNEAGDTIGLLKKKTAWYILVRALREKLKSAVAACRRSASSFSFEEHAAKVQRRVQEIQRWLRLSDATAAAWIDVGRQALRHCVRKMSTDAKLAFADDVFRRFPVVWRQFLDEAGLSDEVGGVGVGGGGGDAAAGAAE